MQHGEKSLIAGNCLGMLFKVPQTNYKLGMVGGAIQTCSYSIH